MSISDIIKKVKHEINVLAGNEAKDKQFSAEKTYSTRKEAEAAFEISRKKLFEVNQWSEMDGINSTFRLYDNLGIPVEGEVKEGYFIKIDLPGPKIENWVHISALRNEQDLAEFIVHPSEKAAEKHDPEAEVQHFFVKEASSTFRVVLTGNTIRVFEIGKNEAINNNGEEAGNRAFLNTLIAEGGWAGFQKIQWEKLTNYLVNKKDA